RFFQTIRDTANWASADYPGTDTIPDELLLNHVQPFFWAWILMFAALVFLAVSLATGLPLAYIGGLALYFSFLRVQGFGFYLRILISGRAPVSNMYESVIFAAFMAAILALILEIIYRRKVIALAGAGVAALALILAHQLPLALDPKIGPMAPILRTNYWLTVHVLTIVSSYAAGPLAWGLGNISLAMLAFGKRAEGRSGFPARPVGPGSPTYSGESDTLKKLGHFTYRAMQIAVLLLAAGTFLGGWWPAESW